MDNVERAKKDFIAQIKHLKFSVLGIVLDLLISQLPALAPRIEFALNVQPHPPLQILHQPAFAVPTSTIMEVEEAVLLVL